MVKQDHVTAGKTVSPVHICKKGSITGGDKILLCGISGETAADDLFDRTVVNVDTWTKTHIPSPGATAPALSLF